MIGAPNDDDTGRGALRTHLGAPEPDLELESRVRRTLITRGLVRPSPTRASAWLSRAGLLAAGVLLGVVIRGNWTGQSDSRPATQPGQYVLLLLGETLGDTGAVHAAREREYGQWAASLTGGARWVGGHELGAVVDDIGPRPPGTPGADRLAGYFVIDAPSRERAAEVARTCPHVKYGGRVVVMEVES